MILRINCFFSILSRAKLCNWIKFSNYARSKKLMNLSDSFSSGWRNWKTSDQFEKYRSESGAKIEDSERHWLFLFSEFISNRSGSSVCWTCKYIMSHLFCPEESCKENFITRLRVWDFGFTLYHLDTIYGTGSTTVRGYLRSRESCTDCSRW